MIQIGVPCVFYGVLLGTKKNYVEFVACILQGSSECENAEVRTYKP